MSARAPTTSTRNISSSTPRSSGWTATTSRSSRWSPATTATRALAGPPGYAALGTDDRIRVCKLAALLRVADALERTHAQRVSQIESAVRPGKLRLRLPGLADAAVERLAMASKGDLFEQVFGLVSSSMKTADGEMLKTDLRAPPPLLKS
jgi:hypothetical protein